MTAALPFVSVVVLNYNGAQVIDRCLAHLLAQTYADFEIVVVDNGSEDGSVARIREHEASGKVRLVRAGANVGVPQGRNLGAATARGSVIAFIDNDGYARPTWLAEAIGALEEGGAGAVASTVFFARHKLILNGAGASLTRSGYAYDTGFNEPFEFVEIPREVLYPMGCGMAVRRALWDEIQPLDAELFNYYDDVELGIRVWSRGGRVVVAPGAWIDHDLSYSEQFTGTKAYLCTRNRVRTVIKYYPAGAVLRWVGAEAIRVARAVAARAADRVRRNGGGSGGGGGRTSGPDAATVARAWAWNVRHLGSALAIRRRFPHRGEFWRLIAAAGDDPATRGADNQAFTPDPAGATSMLRCDGIADRPMLNYGWYPVEHDGGQPFRWSDRHASAFVRAERAAERCTIVLRSAAPCQLVELRWRTVPDLRCVGSTRLHDVPTAWTTRELPAHLPAGTYELLVSVTPARAVARRRLGVAIASARID